MNYDFGGAEVKKAAQGRHAAATKRPGCLKDNHHLLRRRIPLKTQKAVFSLAILLVALTAVSGCKKKTAPLPPSEEAPAASVPTPTAQLSATPTVISAGDQVQLSWKTTNANTVSIDGIGDVPTAGVKTVTPTESTTYHLVAHGDGGSADASAFVTVNSPPAISVPSTAMDEQQDFDAHVQPIFFDYDNYDIRGDAQAILAKNADYLNAHPNIKVVIGGYCDERGSDEYNLVLGQNRAQAAKTALVTAGIASDRIRVISYGKEKPFCSDSTEECWQLNRRDGFTIDK
jgi:peptidoglycan-associated lipoprotein